MPKLPFSIIQSWLTPFLLMVSIGCGAQAPVPEPVTDQETELGQEMYKELTNKGEIIESSPLYDTLRPIADSISRVAQSRYSHPFKFYLVHETQPNGSKHSRSTSAIILQSLPNSIRIQNQRHPSSCRKTLLSSSCVRVAIDR